MSPPGAILANPPQSLDDLHRCVERARALKGRQGMGERTLAVLVDMLSRPGQVAVQSISELAAHNGVDPSTLTRLGKRLGFSGFGELQDVFRQHVSATQPFYSTRVRELVSGTAMGEGSIRLRQLAETECRKVLAVAHALNDEVIEQAARRVLAARHVHVFGLRAGTYALSHFFGSYLEILRDGVTIIGAPGSSLAGEVSAMGKQDLLVAIAFRPYTRTVIGLVDVAREAGVPVLAITDAGSPIDTEADGGMTLRVEQPFYFDSMLAQMYAVEALLVAVARLLGPAATARTQRRELINKALDIEIS
ncbi:MAG: MurR/RpiR family transcriptional regulator [Burkholderiaceae bacterium]